MSHWSDFSSPLWQPMRGLLWSPLTNQRPGTQDCVKCVNVRWSLSSVALAAPVRPLHSGRFHLGDFLGIIRKEFVVSWIISCISWKLWTCWSSRALSVTMFHTPQFGLGDKSKLSVRRTGGEPKPNQIKMFFVITISLVYSFLILFWGHHVTHSVLKMIWSAWNIMSKEWNETISCLICAKLSFWQSGPRW